MIHKIDSDTPFDVVFLDFWEPGGILYRYGYCKIQTYLDCMTVFGIGSASGMKEITSDQVARCYFEKFFVPFKPQKMIVVDTDECFSGVFKKTLQKTLIIPVYEVSRGNHTEIKKLRVSLVLAEGTKDKPRGQGKISPILARSIFCTV